MNSFSGGGFTPKKYPSSGIEQSFCRTHAPKYASYHGDGFGRDSYIILNNGGLASNDKPAMMRRPFRNTNQGDNLNSPRKEAKTLKYTSDGTGRDSYVLAHSGGLVCDYNYKRPDEAFKGWLRAQDRSMVPHVSSTSNGFFSNHQANITTYLNWPSNQARKQGSRNAKVAQNVTKRLSPVRPNMHYEPMLPTNLGK